MPSPPSEAVVKKEQKIREVHISAALMEEFLRFAHWILMHAMIVSPWHVYHTLLADLVVPLSSRLDNPMISQNCIMSAWCYVVVSADIRQATRVLA